MRLVTTRLGNILRAGIWAGAVIIYLAVFSVILLFLIVEDA